MSAKTCWNMYTFHKCLHPITFNAPICHGSLPFYGSLPNSNWLPISCWKDFNIYSPNRADTWNILEETRGTWCSTYLSSQRDMGTHPMFMKEGGERQWRGKQTGKKQDSRDRWMRQHHGARNWWTSKFFNTRSAVDDITGTYTVQSWSDAEQFCMVNGYHVTSSSICRLSNFRDCHKSRTHLEFFINQHPSRWAAADILINIECMLFNFFWEHPAVIARPPLKILFIASIGQRRGINHTWKRAPCGYDTSTVDYACEKPRSLILAAATLFINFMAAQVSLCVGKFYLGMSCCKLSA